MEYQPKLNEKYMHALHWRYFLLKFIKYSHNFLISYFLSWFLTKPGLRFIQVSLDSGSVQVQILLAVYQMIAVHAMARISENGPGWK